MKITSTGLYRMRNRQLAKVTSLMRVSYTRIKGGKPRRVYTAQAWGQDDQGNLFIWNADDGTHNAGGHVKPGTKTFDIVSIHPGRKRRAVAHSNRRGARTAPATP